MHLHVLMMPFAPRFILYTLAVTGTLSTRRRVVS